MRVAVIGAGAVGLGTAALAASLGHRVTVWSRRFAGGDGPIEVASEGAIAGRFPAAATGRLDGAIAEADAVVITLPGWAHRRVIEAAAATLRPDQTAIVSSHASLGALLLRRHAPRTGIVAWGTTVVTGRRTGEHSCRLSNVREAVDAASLPAAETPSGIALCGALFGPRFVARANLIAIQLSNVNPQNHLAMLLCNWTRAERGEDWGNYWGITEAVGRLMEALDDERLALAARFGVQVRTLREHFHHSFQVPLAPVWEQAAMVDARGGAPLGPRSLDTRYISEDVPFGIAVTEWIGRAARVSTPLHDAGVAIMSGLMGRDLREDNDLLPALDFRDVTPEDLLRFAA